MNPSVRVRSTLANIGEELANATENLAQFPEDLEAWADGS